MQTKYGQAPENSCLGNSVIRIIEEETLYRGALRISDKKSIWILIATWIEVYESK